MSSLANTIYPIETLFKLIFIPMAVINTRGTILVAFLITILALLRTLKKPQFNKEYAQRVILSAHGQNLMYIGIGAMGYANFLYYSPLILFFGYGLMEYVKMKYPNTKYSVKYMPYVNMITNQKFYVYEGKAKLEVVFFIFLIFSLPLDFLNRLLKLLITGQYLLMKYRVSQEFQFGCRDIHQLIDNKTKSIGFINSLYNKGINYVYNIATQQPQPQQQPQAQQ